MLEKKYIELLVDRCINFDKSKSVLISYKKDNKNFIDKLVDYIHQKGVQDIYLDEEDVYLTRDKLINSTIEEIENDSYFDKSIWDEYAKKDAAFLTFDSEYPHFFDDVDEAKISAAGNKKRKTRPLFREKETSYQIPWCIAALPNKIWADDMFPNEKNSYQMLEDVIYKMCMVDTPNPIESWNEYLNNVKLRSKKLNSMKIKQLHYSNNLGTDFTISMPEDFLWKSTADDGDNMLVNMPSYEIFSSPDYRTANGIVYSSRPLLYNGGIIDEFYIEFKDGKAINYDARTGKELLKGIIETDAQAAYLGEVALVNNDSPISNTGLVFGTTLFDENAACHIALGDAFPDTIPNFQNYTREELMKLGLNHSVTHVDFMIGTSDLNISAVCENGEVQIFKDGNFVI